MQRGDWIIGHRGPRRFVHSAGWFVGHVGHVVQRPVEDAAVERDTHCIPVVVFERRAEEDIIVREEEALRMSYWISGLRQWYYRLNECSHGLSGFVSVIVVVSMRLLVFATLRRFREDLGSRR